MSALTDSAGFRLTTLVEAQRGLSEFEAYQYLITGEIPDLTQLPDDPQNLRGEPDVQVMSLSDARSWLAGNVPLVASSFLELSESHSESLNGETFTFKFNPNQPRGEDGKWVEFPGSGGGVDLPMMETPAGSRVTTGKKATPAVIYKKHADGAVVAETSDSRMRWNASAKKFVVEERTDADWQETSQLTKSAAYNELKTPDRWFEPGDVPVSTPTPEPTAQDQVTSPTLSLPDGWVKKPNGTYEKKYPDHHPHSESLIEDLDGEWSHEFFNGKSSKFKVTKHDSLDDALAYDPTAESAPTLTPAPVAKKNAWPFTKEQDQSVQMDYGHLVQDTDADYAANPHYSLTQVKVSDLIPSQDDDGEDIGTGDEDGQTGRPLVVEQGGKKYLLDGHHRAKQAGKDGTLEAWITSVDDTGQTGTNVETVVPPQTPDVTPADSQLTAKITSAPSAYTGPRFEIPENVDLALVDNFRRAMARNLYDSRRIDDLAWELRQQNPEKYEGYEGIARAQQEVKAQLTAKGELSDQTESGTALSALLDSMDDLSYQDREYIRRRAHVEASVESHMMAFADKYDLGKVTPKLKREMAKRVKDAFADKKIAMRVTPKNLEHILRDGRIKSQFETGKSKGMNNQVGRAAAEKIMFGIDPSITQDVERRPIYGYVAVDGIRPALFHDGTLGGIGTDALSQYGQIQIVMKDEIRNRTTAMYGDSLNHDSFGVPSPINEPSWLSFTPSTTQSLIMGNFTDLDRDPRDFKLRSQTYVEAQMHDGVSTDDIAEVVFPSKPSAALQSLLTERGIPWRVLTLKSGAQSDGELGETSRLYAKQQRDYAQTKISELQEQVDKYKSEGHPPSYYDNTSKDIQRLQKLLKDAEAALAVK